MDMVTLESYENAAESLHLLADWPGDELLQESLYVRDICEIGARTIKELLHKLAYHEDAEEQGRLVILPCKIGDWVYEIDLPEYGVIVCNVLCFTYGRSNITRELTWSVTVEVIKGHGLGSCYTFDRDDFGKTVFFTRAEAEAALMDGDRE